jgi:hypothetical protein
MEMRQPHRTITTGVRQPMEAFETEGIEVAMTTTCFANPRTIAGADTRRLLVRRRALILKQKLGVPSSADAWQLVSPRLATGWR